MLLDHIFAVDNAGFSTAFEIAVVAARQNLKTALFQMCAIGWLFVTDQRLITWSAHEFRTSQEAFRDMAELIMGYESLASRVDHVYYSHGEEAIELLTGQRLIFKARTKGGGRGLSGDKVVLDEAYALRPAHMGALVPTLSARPDPQLLYGSSSGHFDSTVLHGIRKRGMVGSERMVYAEWSDTEAMSCLSEDCDHETIREGCCLDDEQRWERANPALGRRISIEYIRSERLALPPEEFARERLGWWDEPTEAEQSLTVDDWKLLEDADAEPSGSLTLGLDVAPGHAAASIVVYGGGVLELIERRKGVGWLVPRVAEVLERQEIAAVAYDPAGPIGSLAKDFLAAGVTLTPVDGKESVRACGAIVLSVHDKAFRHRGEAEFEAAVQGARQRPVGDGHKWSRKDSTVDISPLVAATNALWISGDIGEVEYDVLDSVY